jgi:hypothetical protein
MSFGHVLPLDELEFLHTYENCFCHPATLYGVTYHRSLSLIDRCGREGKYITGYVALECPLFDFNPQKGTARHLKK